jgi:hypothetical protein
VSAITQAVEKYLAKELPDLNPREGIALDIEEAVVGAIRATSAIEVLEQLRDSLPQGHAELPGVIRAIEVLRYDLPVRPGLVGRDDYVVESFAKQAATAANARHEVTKLRQVHRGYAFDVRYVGDSARTQTEPTGHIIRVTTVLDRLETPEELAADREAVSNQPATKRR